MTALAKRFEKWNHYACKTKELFDVIQDITNLPSILVDCLLFFLSSPSIKMTSLGIRELKDLFLCRLKIDRVDTVEAIEEFKKLRAFKYVEITIRIIYIQAIIMSVR